MDWNVGPDTTFYGRLQFGYEKRAGGVSFLGSTGAGWPQQPSKYEIDTVSYVNTLLHTFNPTTFAEFTVGVNWSHRYRARSNQQARDINDRTKVLPGLSQYFPSANPDNLMPQASFSGGSPGNVASFNVENRWPFFGYNRLWNFSGNLTKIKGVHTMKTGLFVEHTTRPAQRSSQFNGNLSFNTDGQAPLNTNMGFANALIGAVTSYSESDGHPSAHGQFVNTEFYASGQLACEPEVHDRCGRSLLLHHADPERRRRGRGLWSERLERISSAAAVPACVDCAGPSCAEPADGGDSPGRLHRSSRARFRQLHQRDGSVRRYTAAEIAVQGRAPYRLCVGRVWRRQDRGPWRRRYLLRSILGRQHPRPDRAAAGPEHRTTCSTRRSPSC